MNLPEHCARVYDSVVGARNLAAGIVETLFLDASAVSAAHSKAPFDPDIACAWHAYLTWNRRLLVLQELAGDLDRDNPANEDQP